MNDPEALRSALMGLFAACLLVSLVDSLFDEGAEGFRLTCGLVLALCAIRLAAGFLS